MTRSTDLCYFCVVLSVCIVTGAKAGEYEKIRGDYKTSPFYRWDENKKNVSRRISEYRSSPKEMNTVVTECITPNLDPGHCMEIKNCGKLLKQVTNKQAVSFILASRCGPPNENIYNPKVCCGKYDNYKNITDDNIFPKYCGRQNVIFDRRIVGGKEALLGEYPWMARIIHKIPNGPNKVGCSGFLIHPNFIITAAHCTHPRLVSSRGPVDFVVLGEHNTVTETDCSEDGTMCAQQNQLIRVAKVTTHPDYNPEDISHYNDIAIIHLRRPARMSDFVQPICLLKEFAETPHRYYLSGWGKTEKELYSTIKIKIEIPPFDKEKCKKLYALYGMDLDETQICAGGENQRDSCTGDSGGPLMMSTDDGLWYASGVVSFGMGCGISGWPGVYTDLVKFLPWIKSEIMLNMSNRSKRRRRRHNTRKIL